MGSTVEGGADHNVDGDARKSASMEDIFQTFQRLSLDAHALKDELKGLLRLDSVEKHWFTKFYGQHAEVKYKPQLDVQDDIHQVIEDFQTTKIGYRLINMQDLKRIDDYTSEFQHKESRKCGVKTINTSKNHIRGISWNNKEVTELFSRNVKREFNDREGWIGVGSFLPVKVDRQKTQPNTGFGKASRFVKSTLFCTPPPGTYKPGKQLKKPTSLLPSIEWSCERKEPCQDDKLPANIYHPKFNTLSNIVKRKVSKRGPYDTFTGPRDSTTIKNHFAPGIPAKIKWWPMQFPGPLDNPNPYGPGHFTKSQRFPVSKRDLGRYPTPAPNQDQKFCMTPNKFKPSKYPFNNCIKFIWSKPMKTFPMPGPGRYEGDIVKRPIKGETNKKSKRREKKKLAPVQSSNTRNTKK